MERNIYHRGQHTNYIFVSEDIIQESIISGDSDVGYSYVSMHRAVSVNELVINTDMSMLMKIVIVSLPLYVDMDANNNGSRISF